MAILTYENYDADEVEQAKMAVVELTKETSPNNALDLFYSENLEEIETGIKQLNEYSSKCWILSAIALYTLVYDKSIYSQSGLDWQTYQKQAKERLGLDPREVSEQLSGARFFIANRVKLINAGWTTSVPNQSLARGIMATELSGSVDETIDMMVHSTVREFRDWYQSFKLLPQEPAPVIDKRPDVKIVNHVVKINNVQAITISDEIPEQDRVKLQEYIEKIYEALKRGDVPAIVPVYDESEARTLVRLRDKNRQKK